jgi:hypothetical protein
MTHAQTIMVDVLFRNFDRPGDECILDMCHSNVMKQAGMFDSSGLRFENTPYAKRFRHEKRLACETTHSDSCTGVQGLMTPGKMLGLM